MRVGVYTGRVRVRSIFSVSAVIILFCFISGMFITRASPIFKIRAADAASQEVRRIVADVASRTIAENDVDLIEKTIGSSGEISMLSINSVQLNKLRAEFTSELISQLSKSTKTTISISLGSLLNKEIFQGAGVRIPAKITFGSISDVDFEDEFISVGINQTKHLVSLKVTVTTAVVSAFMCDTREIETSLPLCENIIIGKAPQYYSDRLGIAAKGE